MVRRSEIRMGVQISESRRQSIERFLTDLLGVVVGIWLALGFGGVVESCKERGLAREAAGFIENEIRDNQHDVESLLKSFATTKQDFRDQMKAVDGLLDGGGARQGGGSNRSFSLRFTLIALSTTSRDTAETTGAFRHMSYAKAKRYAGAYDLQQEFMRLYQRLRDQYLLLEAVARAPFDRLTPPELQTLRQSYATAVVYLRATEDWGKTLLGSYDAALKGK
jgi:hypothetical protein